MNPFDFSWMIGRHVTVSYAEPGTWVIEFGDAARINVGCPWRLLHQERIAVSGEDHQQMFGLPAPVDAAARATSLLSGMVVLRFEVREGTADIIIEFDGDRRLEIIPFSSGYESWLVVSPTGASVVAQGGGQLSAW